MHVLILNQPFYPDVVATAQHMWDLAQHLSQHGHRVSVICSRTFYGTDQQHAHRFEKIGNIEIHRVGGTALGKKSLVARLLDFISFYIAAAWRMQNITPPDVIVALTTPPMISTLAAIYRRFHRTRDGRHVRFVYYVMDLYPEVAVASGMIRRRSPLRWLFHRITGRTLQLADAIIALGHDMRMRILDSYHPFVRAEKIEIIWPWADTRELKPISKRRNPLAKELGLRDTFNVVYSGNLGIVHDIDTLIAAIHTTVNDPDLQWIFIGAGKRFESLRQRAKLSNWSHVRFLPYQQRDRLPLSLNLADVHLVTQLPAYTGLVVPSKLFGILAVARPVITVGPPDAECSRIIAEHDAGYVIPNGHAFELVERIRHLRDNPKLATQMGKRGRAAAKSIYDRALACQRVEKLLQRVTAHTSAPQTRPPAES